jgi:glutamine synthetase
MHSRLSRLSTKIIGRTLLRGSIRSHATESNEALFGKHVFRGAIAAPYLKKEGLPENTLDSKDWTINGNADKVANAVLHWAKDNGASTYCHWFQPLASSGVRHGQSAQVQNKMYEFDKKGV